MYTLITYGSDGRIKGLERLGKSEVEDFVNNVYGKWANIRITNDVTGETRYFLDDGEKWDRVS